MASGSTGLLSGKSAERQSEMGRAHSDSTGSVHRHQLTRSVAGLKSERLGPSSAEGVQAIPTARPLEKVRGSNPFSSTKPAGQRPRRRLHAGGQRDHSPFIRHRWFSRTVRPRPVLGGPAHLSVMKPPAPSATSSSRSCPPPSWPLAWGSASRPSTTRKERARDRRPPTLGDRHLRRRVRELETSTVASPGRGCATSVALVIRMTPTTLTSTTSITCAVLNLGWLLRHAGGGAGVVDQDVKAALGLHLL